jgi:signal transduction histidine kinase
VTTDATVEPVGTPDRLASPARLRVLAETHLMDAAPDEAFDRIVRVLARTVDAPVALLSLVDDARQFFLSSTGLAEAVASRRGTDLSHSICQHVVITDRPFLVTDATRDARVATNHAVEELNMMAYAGVPVRAPGGESLGALCAIDDRPRDWTAEELETLQVLSRAVSSEVALRLAASRQRTLVTQARHRLGTPLAALFVQLEHVTGRAHLDPDLHEQLAGARTQLRRLADEFEDLVANTPAGPFGHEDLIDLRDLLMKIAAGWNELGRATDPQLSVEAPLAVHLRVPSAALRDALDVLVHTGRDEGRAATSLAAWQDGHTTRIRVGFVAPGLPAATLARLLRRRDHERSADAPEPFSLAELVSFRLGGRLAVASGDHALDLVLPRRAPDHEAR